MNALFERLRKDCNQARLARNTASANLLSTVISEVTKLEKDRPGKPPVEEDVIKIIRKFVQSAEETKAAMIQTGRGGVELVDEEIVLLSNYLPQLMGDTEVQEAIRQFVAANPGAQIGAVMGHLKTTYAGRYDGKRASELVKTALAG